MSHQPKLTNLTRLQVKRRFFRRPIVVFQVQVEHKWRRHEGSNIHIGTHYYWRDATPDEFEFFQERNLYLKDLARHSE